MTHYKSFRDPEIGEEVSYHLKVMVAENQLRAFAFGSCAFLPGTFTTVIWGDIYRGV